MTRQAAKGEAATDEAGAGGASYEPARDQLIEVVRRLEAGGTSLEESIALWEQGERLARTCQEFLDGARERLDQVIGAKDDA